MGIIFIINSNIIIGTFTNKNSIFSIKFTATIEVIINGFVVGSHDYA